MAIHLARQIYKINKYKNVLGILLEARAEAHREVVRLKGERLPK